MEFLFGSVYSTLFFVVWSETRFYSIARAIQINIYTDKLALRCCVNLASNIGV